MEKLKNIHPGEILLEEFLIPMEISAYRLAKETFLPQTRISEIIKGNRRITADTALRFAKFLERVPSFGWAFKTITTSKKSEIKKRPSSTTSSHSKAMLLR